MPVTDISHDLENLTLTINALFAAPVQRIWDIYADPRQLEKVWGPPEYPATFVDHDLSPGGRMNYLMTGPGGDKHYGYWEVTSVEAPRSFSYRDGFANEDFTPNTKLPAALTDCTFEERDGATYASFISHYPTREGLRQVLDMGVEEGSTSAINQIDALIA